MIDAKVGHKKIKVCLITLATFLTVVMAAINFGENHLYQGISQNYKTLNETLQHASSSSIASYSVSCMQTIIDMNKLAREGMVPPTYYLEFGMPNVIFFNNILKKFPGSFFLKYAVTSIVKLENVTSTSIF